MLWPLLSSRAESFGAGGGIIIVGLTSAIWIGLFVKLLQKAGL